ncbi:MAG: MmgE/PrpD family protein [Actinomycetota bacterium]
MLVDAATMARFACRTTLSDVPPDVAQTGRLLLLDTLGALVGGLQYPQVQALARAVRSVEPDGPEDAPFGRLLTLGTAATWLDADSGGSFHPQGHRLLPVPTAHPAPHSLPVLLHAAAAGDLTDERLLELFVLANELGLRFGVGTSLRPGLHPHGIHGPVAAAVAAALVAGLDEDATAHALLLGASLPLAATLQVPVRGGTVRNAWTGLGCFIGAQAAGRARDGAHGDAAVVAELFGSAVCTDLDAEELSGGLGSRWRLPDSYLKPYACARWIHPALDAWRNALRRSGVDIAEAARHVDGIDVETFAFAAALGAREVTSDMHARFSLPTCLAVLALDGELVAGSFLPNRLRRPGVGELAARVHVREEPAFSAALPRERPTRVTVRWRDGGSTSAEVRNARGNPDDPLSRDEVEQKFLRNVDGVVGAGLARDVLASVLDADPAGPRSLAALARALVGTWCP